MSKAYDRVNLHMLDRALIRLKIPFAFRALLLSLFTNRTNRVITQNGLTDPYNVLIGIDQGEVISPLLWCIYYDPLLCEIHSRQDLGYHIKHTWFTDLNNPGNLQTLSERVTSQAYMDDTNWITSSKSQLEQILSISQDFYTLNNISVNHNKAVLMTTEAIEVTSPSKLLVDKVTLPICLSAGPDQPNVILTPLKRLQSVCLFTY